MPARAAARAPKHEPPPERSGGGVVSGRVGGARVAEAPARYFTCSASHFAALACASETPCLPAA